MTITEAQFQEAYKEALAHGEKLPYEEYKKRLAEYYNNSEQATAVTTETSAFLQNVPNRRNVMIPPPPKAGEIISCQICGQKMYPKDFSTNPTIRKREFKWHIHNKCFEHLDNLANRSTPGLLSERKNK